MTKDDFAAVYISDSGPLDVSAKSEVLARLSGKKGGDGDWQDQPFIDYLIRFGWSFGRERGYTPDVIEEGISNGLLKIVKAAHTYDEEKGTLQTWCTTIIRNSITHEARFSMQGMEKLVAVSINETTDDGETAVEEFAALQDEPEYDLDAEHDKEIRRVRRKIAKEALGGDMYKIALAEIAGGAGWRRRVASRMGVTAQSVGWRVQKARKEYERIKDRLHGIG